MGNSTYSIYDEDIVKRNNLVSEINSRGFNSIVEEVAYTWFNRIIAIRFMELNNYLPSKIRVLSNETKLIPAIYHILKENSGFLPIIYLKENVEHQNNTIFYIFAIRKKLLIIATIIKNMDCKKLVYLKT